MNGEGENDDAWSEVPYVLYYSPPCLIRVVKVGIGQAGIPPLLHAQDFGGTLGLLGTELGAASGPGLPRRKVEDPRPIAGVHGLEERTGAGELDVIAVGGDRQDVDRHGGI